MEAILRVALLSIAVFVVLMIGLNAWFKMRRSAKLRKTADITDETDFSADAVLGLDKLDEEKIEPQVFKANINEAVALEEVTMVSPNHVAAMPLKASDLIIMHVIAKPGDQFGSYELLQTLQSCGLQFGEMNIFHYRIPAALNSVNIFSVASAMEPGDFDLDKIGDYYTKGLTLFCDLNNVPDPARALEIMHQTAHQIAEDLDCVLLCESKKPLNAFELQQYWHRVHKYKKLEHA